MEELTQPVERLLKDSSERGINLRGILKGAESLFERTLWGSRLIMMIGVVFSALMALGAFYMATVDAFYLLKYLVGYADPALTAELRSDLRAQAVTNIVKAVDGYLIAAILVIFSLGLYELFISRINVAKDSEVGPRLLRVLSLDDLKDRIAKLLLLVLMIEFFQRALQMQYGSALELLYLALGILLIGAAFYLSNLRVKQGSKQLES